MAKAARTPVAASTKTKQRAASAAPAEPGGNVDMQTLRSPTDVAIATELAPAVAIALLGKTEHAVGQAAAALEPLAAGAVASDADGKLRVQLLFENGAVLPIEMSEEAAAALGKGIAKELRKG